MANPTPNLGIQSFYSTTLAQAVGTTDTIFYLNGTLPTPSEGYLTIDLGNSNVEVIHYVSKGANYVQLTDVTDRGQDNTSASAHGVGATVKMTVNAAYWTSIQNMKAISAGVVGSTPFADGWTPTLMTLNYGANNGNKEFTITVTGDQTGIFTVGDKIKIARGTTPPTQSMAFASASSQYATKASPTGITFTQNYTCEAWIYLLSYPNAGVVIGRTDSTNANGWQMFVDTNGRLVLYGLSANNGKSATSVSCLPLKRWVHVAATFALGTGAATMYFNGQTVAVNTANLGTGGTVLTQSGNLSIGANAVGGTPGNFFNGYVSEARVWSVVQSQASIQSNMAISLTGSETNLVALFQGNGNFNDKTTNANNLTATNGPIATQAANPYNAIEYGIITAASYVNPTTTLTVFTGTDYNIPNQTFGTSYYSHQRSPYGFPTARSKWRVEYFDLFYSGSSTTISSNIWTNYQSDQIYIPTGEWIVGYRGFMWKGSVTNTGSLLASLSTANNAEGDRKWRTGVYFGGTTSGTVDIMGEVSVEDTLSLASQTLHYLVTNTAGTTGGFAWRPDLGAVTHIYADCAYL